jgi:uncharacterized protein (TIGR04255 family)
MAITFDDPPLNEVVVGRTFVPRPDFLVPHFGLFWGLVRDRFPKVAHAPPIVSERLQLEEGVFLPRIWLLADDSRSLIQLQQDRFHYNWRQTEEPTSYVRFPSIQSECLKFWELFEQFVLRETGQPLRPLTAELSYINFISIEGVHDRAKVTEAVLRDGKWEQLARFLPEPMVRSTAYVFPMPAGLGELQVSSAIAERKSAGQIGLKLELTARGQPSEALSFQDWTTGAHDFLVEAFRDLTTPEMHALWKLREANNG